MIDVDTSELDRWARLLVRAGVEITVINEERLTEQAKKLQARARAAAPVRTGALSKSVYRRGGKEWRRVGSPLKQGFFQEFGTSRHGPQPWLFGNAEEVGADLMNELGKDGYRVLLR